MSGCIKCNGITLFRGEDGNGIASIAWESNSGGSPQFTQGTTDTYVINYTDGTKTTFGVYNGADGAQGIPGTNGTNGTDGTDGVYGGWSSEWTYDGTSTSPTTPVLTAGDFRFNDGTLNAVTEIYIHDTNSDATNLQAFLDAWNNSGNFGLVRISKKDDPNVFWMGAITAEADTGDYHTIGVTHVVSNGTFSDNDSFVVSFVNNGIQGIQGPAGNDGADSNFQGLASTITDESIGNTTVEATLLGIVQGSFSLGAGTLNIGSTYQIQAFGDITTGITSALDIRLTSGGLEIAVANGILASPVSGMWELNIIFTVRTIGASGSIAITGVFSYDDGSGDRISHPMDNVDVIDTTVPNSLGLTAQWAVANAGNIITSKTVIFTKT